jgi:hypothetical protein
MMDKVFLDRFAYTPFGTFGRLRVGDFLCFTIERKWLDNEPFISCIPAGAYIMTLGNFGGNYPNYELQDVPGRSAIEIHRGNTSEDVKGCIAVGYRLGTSYDKWAVTSSADAMRGYMKAMGGVPEALLVVSNLWDYMRDYNGA